MKRQMIRAIALLVLTFTVISSFFFLPSSAAQEPVPPKAEYCRAACIYDKTHNKVLLMENPDTLLNTSTSAKVMMGLLVCELLKERLDESVTLTDSMLQGSSGYSMALTSGEEIKIKELMYGAICGSYNDAAYALASVCAGSSAAFVSLMNERAKALGASSTSYTNPIGYPDSDAMVTTLSDTLKIACEASENELYMEICSAKSHTVPKTNMTSQRTVYNRNYLVSSHSTGAYYNSACSGMNAGISGERGGWSIIAQAKDDGADYICIILGGEESEDGGRIYAYDTANKLLDWAFETYNSYKIFSKGQLLGQAKVSLTALGSQTVDYYAADELSVYIPDHSHPDITYKVNYTSERLTAPIKAGEKIGNAVVYCNGETVGACDIVLSEDVESNAFMQVMDAIGGYTKSRAFIAAAVCFVILLPAVLFIRAKKLRRRSFGRKY